MVTDGVRICRCDQPLPSPLMLGRRYAGRRIFARLLARFYNEKPPVTAAGDGMDFFCIYWNCAESESGSC